VNKYYKPIAASVFILTLILIGIKNNLQNVMKDDGHYTPTKDPLTPYELNPPKQCCKNLKSCEVSMLLHMLNYTFLS